MLTLLGEARIYRPDLKARFLLNRCAARTILARETAETLADHDPPPLLTTIGQRIAFADVVQTGRLAAEQDDASPAAREITALAAEVRSEEHASELQSLMRNSYAVFCLKTKNIQHI